MVEMLDDDWMSAVEISERWILPWRETAWALKRMAQEMADQVEMRIVIRMAHKKTETVRQYRRRPQPAEPVYPGWLAPRATVTCKGRVVKGRAAIR